MENFIGILFAITQGPKKGGIVRTFYVCIDILFPAPDLGKFVLKRLCFKELFYYWTYANIDDGDNADKSDPYWAKDRIVHQFNDH